MWNSKTNLPKELYEKAKQLVASGDDAKMFEFIAKYIKCTIRDDGINECGYTCNTLWDYLQVVDDLMGETNTNCRTLVRLWGKDIHPLYADWLIVCPAEDLASLVGKLKNSCDTPEKLKKSYAELLKNVIQHAPQTVEILRSKSYEVYEKQQHFKRAQYDVVMGLYCVKYLLLGKPFNLATEYSQSNFEYDLHEWCELTGTMECWNDFVKERHEHRHGVVSKCLPKDKRIASYLLDERGSSFFTEKQSHEIMRSVRQVRKGKHPLVSRENGLIQPFDEVDFNGKKWSGVILSGLVVKTENDTSTEPAPNRDEIIHTIMWDVFGRDTTEMAGKNFSVLLFNNQRRRDLAYEWMKGEPVVYDD
jgi:DNA-directed RNA polymerase subunit L